MTDTEPSVQRALSKQGCPYVWGATGPDTFDCSGLIQWAYGPDFSIGRTTYQQVFNGEKVVGPPQRGDLVFPDAGHVMIALGGNQGLHAPESGDVVKISNYWTTPFAVRRLGPNSGSVGSTAVDPQYGAPDGPLSLDMFGSDQSGEGRLQNAVDATQVADMKATLDGVVSIFEKVATFMNFMIGETGWSRYLKVVLGTLLLSVGTWFVLKSVTMPDLQFRDVVKGKMFTEAMSNDPASSDATE